jgi:hypothetical protein
LQTSLFCCRIAMFSGFEILEPEDQNLCWPLLGILLRKESVSL